MKKSKFANINFESVEVLSREQMSKVKGGYGGGATFSCTCQGSTGSWEGNYSNSTQISSAITRYCASNNANCYQM